MTKPGQGEVHIQGKQTVESYKTNMKGRGGRERVLNIKIALRERKKERKRAAESEKKWS